MSPRRIFGWLTVVMLGMVMEEMSMLSKPVTFRSWGTRIPTRCAARITDAA